MTIRVGKIAHIGRELDSTHDKLLAAIARSAEELTSGSGWPDGVIHLMEDLGKITGVSRVWIFQTIEIGPNHVIQDYPFEWADRPEHVQLHMPMFSMFRTNFDDEDYRTLVESRQRGEWQSVITAELPPSWFREDQEQQNILSMLTIPIMVDGAWWGTLGFDDCKRAYQWSDVEIALLRTATYLISNAIIRDRLAAKTKQFDILQTITESSSWELNIKTGHFWCSPEIIGNWGGLTQSVHMGVREMLRMVHPDDRKELLAGVRRFLRDQHGGFRHDLRLATECGNYVWVEAIGALSLDSDGRPENFAGIAVEILKRKQEEEKLRWQAKNDPLTGAANRAAFDKELTRLLEESLNLGTGFTLLLADLDHFKDVNDAWGHAAGDAVLQHFVAVCRKNLRRTDTLARIGGEEFALLLPDAREEAGRVIGERIREEFRSSPAKHNEQDVASTVSMGCAAFPCAMAVESRSQFFQLADLALYTAKRAGRDRLVSTADLDMPCPIRSRKESGQ